ncbi:hypothetical protein, partial [Acidiphilium angustum]|uniref:hypothetical protein n=1 Tax=Acidiphilium angustum TaxID=523 RepID=UPI001B80773E
KGLSGHCRRHPAPKVGPLIKRSKSTLRSIVNVAFTLGVFLYLPCPDHDTGPSLVSTSLFDIAKHTKLKRSESPM